MTPVVGADSGLSLPARWLTRFRLPAVRSREVAPLAVLSVVSMIGTVISPTMRNEGMLVAMLSPRLVFLGVAASQNSVVPFVVLATIRLCLADPWHYRLGRTHGTVLLERFGRLGRLFGRLGERTWLVLFVVALRPIGRHLMWAGTRRINPLIVAATDVVATAVFCLAVKTGVDLLPW